MAEAGEKSSLLTRSELFAGLPSSACTHILSRARPMDFPCSQVMYFAGVPGEVISELALVSGSKQSSTAQAIQDCKVLAWDSATFEAAIERFPVLRCNAKSILEQRLQELERRFCEVSTETVSPRLAHGLVRLLDQIGHKVNSHVEINVSQEALAQMTAMTSFSVCRLLTNWEDQGLVKLRREVIEIHSVPRLLELCKAK